MVCGLRNLTILSNERGSLALLPVTHQEVGELLQGVILVREGSPQAVMGLLPPCLGYGELRGYC